MDKLEVIQTVIQFLPLADRLDQAGESGEGITLTADELTNLTDFVDVVMTFVEQAQVTVK